METTIDTRLSLDEALLDAARDSHLTVEHRCQEPGCGKVFATEQGLKAHVTRSHKTKPKKRKAVKPVGPKSVDKDKLLAIVFPNGLPAREEAVARAAEWLDEAEELWRMR